MGMVGIKEEQKNAAVPKVVVGISSYPNPTDVCLIFLAQYKWFCFSVGKSLYPCRSCMLFVVVICDPLSICTILLIS